MDFIHDVRSPRTLFAKGALSQLPAEVETLGKKKVLLISDENTNSVAGDIKKTLGSLVVDHVERVVMHVPDDFSAPILSKAKSQGIDLVVAVGGGSSTGLGKIIALENHVDLLVVPTTYAGSEMTPIWGRTANNEKLTGRAPHVLPKVVIYDPTLTYSLPLGISVNSGMNAIAHAVEALYSPKVSPLVQQAAYEGIRVMAEGLRALAKNINDESARERLLYGTFLCGFTLGNSTMGIHHKICHQLGGMFNLPHAPMHSAVLPYAIAYNEAAARDVLEPLAKILNARTASQGIWDLSKEIGSETSLENIGFPVIESEKVADLMASYPLVNPRPFERDAVVKLLKVANSGVRPDGESR